MIRIIIFLILTCSAWLSADINSLIEKAGKNAQVAISLKRLKDNHTIYSYNDKALLIPASNLKLISLAAVLNELGPDFKFSTDFFWNEKELRIKGSGDPAISDRYHKREFHIFQKIRSKLLKRKITEIEQITADNSLFSGPNTPPDWEKADKTFYYAPEISALSFNDNCIDLVTNGVNTDWFPFKTNFMEIVNQQKIVAVNKRYEEKIEKNKNTFILKSSVPINTNHREYLTVSNPAEFTIHSLRRFLFQSKIDCGVIKVYDKTPDYKDFKKIFTHSSPPLTRLLKTAACNSNNFFTEMLTWTASAHHYKGTGSYQNSIKFLNDFIKGLQLPPQKLTDSCGLSRTNRLSANFITTFLGKMHANKQADTFINMLPLSGTNRALRFLPKRLKGKIRAKTGSMKGIYCLSGYIEGTHSFSILLNNSPLTKEELKQITATILNELFAIATRK